MIEDLAYKPKQQSLKILELSYQDLHQYNQEYQEELFVHLGLILIAIVVMCLLVG